MCKYWGALCALAILFVGTSAAAQVPSTAAPGRIEERFKTPLLPQTAPEIQIPGPEAPMPTAEAAKIHFTLQYVGIDGATAFSWKDFEPLYAPLIGKDVTLAQIFELRDAITAKYRSAGYVLSQAIIPPQKIAGGVVHMKIIEGYIDRVEFQGDARDRRGLIKRIAENITESRPLRVSVLERYVLLVSDIPGVSVRTVIKPSEGTPGAATLVFILDHRTVAGQVQIDNRGSRAIGPEQGVVSIDLNSLLGLDEQTSLLLATTGQPKQLQYGQVTSTMLLSPEGLRFIASGSYSDSKPSGSIAPLDAIGHTLTLHGTLDAPLLRSRSENFHISLGFTYLNSRTDLLGTPFSNDRLRYFTARAAYDFSDTLLGDGYPASTIISAELSQGFDILDANKTGSANLSRAGGHSDFTLVYGEATRIQSLFENASLVLSVAGQHAASPLLTSVQFGLGGSRFGRGYEPSELTGDDGVAGSIEGRYDLPSIAEFLGHPQLYAFYDVGQIWNQEAPLGTPPRESLASVGGGVRFTLLGHFDLDLGLAKPLTRAIASRGNKDVRPLFSISTRF
jgi:hemolysin activation/secretion protein